jgi:hypothetical protein
MSLLNRLERLFGRFALENVSLYLVAGQVFVFLMAMLGRDFTGLIALRADLVFAGEYWRPFTFIFDPPLASPVFIAFAWYMFYLMGSALEHFWGVFRYNLFLFLGWLFTVGVAFAVPHVVVTNLFAAGSVFLAFAYLNPDFELLIFFILPVKVKWIALIQWVGYAFLLVVESWPGRLMVLASIGNFLVFFSGDIVRRMRSGRRRMAQQTRQFSAKNDPEEPRHRCHTCGKTDLSHPQMEFRYCSKCAGEECYCSEHIANHVHTTVAATLRD